MQLLRAELGDDFGQTLREIGIFAVGRFEIRLELLGYFGRTLHEIGGPHDYGIGLAGQIVLVSVEKFRLEERVV